MLTIFYSDLHPSCPHNKVMRSIYMNIILNPLLFLSIVMVVRGKIMNCIKKYLVSYHITNTNNERNS